MAESQLLKALSIHQPWASLIASGTKTIETRSWATRYRGPLAICSTKRCTSEDTLHLPRGYLLAVVQLVDCRPFTAEDVPAACCPWRPDAWAWILAEPRLVDPPLPVRGQQGLFQIPWPPPA